jgi:hypothetical protein
MNNYFSIAEQSGNPALSVIDDFMGSYQRKLIWQH